MAFKKAGSKPKSSERFDGQKIDAVTPAGVLAYAWIDKPDTGKRYSDDKYKATILLPKDGEGNFAIGKEKFAGTVKEFVQKLVKIGGKKLIKDGDAHAEEKDKPEFAGHYMLQAKTKNKPTLVDAKRKPLPSSVKVMSGDVAKLAITINEYEEGKFNVYLNAVQLIEKRARSGFDAEDAFDDEDGFEAGERGDEEEEAEGGEGQPADDELDF